MSNEPSENPAETSLENFARSAQDKAQLALQTGRDYVKENPLPVIVGAFLLGALLGAFLSRREAAPPEKAHALRDWLEDTQAQLTDTIQHCAKDIFSNGQEKLDKAIEASRKLKFW